MSKYVGGTNNYITLDEHTYDDLDKEVGDIGIIKNLLEFGSNCLKSILGQELDFYGAESQSFKVGDQVIEVLENPDDGYRSFLGGFLSHDESKFNFYTKPFARVRLEHCGTEAIQDPKYPAEDHGTVLIESDFDGYKLVDVVDNHIWLEFGTNYSDDYYPCFVFSYTPK